MKMNHIFILTILSIILSNCSNSTGSDNEIPEYVWKQTHTIEEFIVEFEDADILIDTVAIVGVVQSTDEEKNLSNTLYITDATASLAVRVDGDNIYETYPVGTEILIKILGMKVEAKSRTLSLADGSSIPLNSPDSLIIKTDNIKDVKANYIGITSLETSDINFYYRFINFQFDESDVGETFVLNNSETIRTVTDNNGVELDIIFSAEATFANEIIPSKAGYIYGFLTYENDDYAIRVSKFEDMQFTSDRRAPFAKQTFEWDGNTLPYQIMYPRNYDENSSYPLVMFMHGAGERGSNNTSQMAYGPDTFGSYDARTDYPAIVVFPQCPSDVMWSRREKYTNDDGVLIFEFPVEDEPNYAMEMAIELVRSLITDEAVNENRIYISGLSMGGIGAFEFAYYAPDLPAAISTIAGGHDSTLVANYVENIDFQIYHGDSDGVVPYRYSEQIYLKMQELGANAEFFLAEGRGHEWNYVLDNPDYISWLFAQQRDK